MNGGYGLSANIQKQACQDPVRKETYPVFGADQLAARRHGERLLPQTEAGRSSCGEARLAADGPRLKRRAIERRTGWRIAIRNFAARRPQQPPKNKPAATVTRVPLQAAAKGRRFNCAVIAVFFGCHPEEDFNSDEGSAVPLPQTISSGKRRNLGRMEHHFTGASPFRSSRITSLSLYVVL